MTAHTTGTAPNILEKASQELEEARAALEVVLEEVSRGGGAERDLESTPR